MFGAAGKLIVIGKVFCVDCCGLPESRTLKVGEDAPAVVGVPVSTPLEIRLSPTGNEPLARSHVIAPVPPEAATAAV